MIRRIRALAGPALLLLAGLALDIRLGVPGAVLASLVGVVAVLWGTLALDHVANAEAERRRNEWRAGR